MGAYINSRNMTKEDWLVINGVPTTLNSLKYWDDLLQGTLPVCLVDNGHFTAAGIAYCKEELECFKRNDGRLKKWYIVETHKLHEVSPELKMYLANVKERK